MLILIAFIGGMAVDHFFYEKIKNFRTVRKVKSQIISKNKPRFRGFLL